MKRRVGSRNIETGLRIRRCASSSLGTTAMTSTGPANLVEDDGLNVMTICVDNESGKQARRAYGRLATDPGEIVQPQIQMSINTMIREYPPRGRRVLELGATLESAPGFRAALPDCEYTGLDLVADDEAQAAGIIAGNANQMPFEDNSFDGIITSSMFEHDPHFWLTVDEVRRVLVPLGRFYILVPGFADNISRTSTYARAVRNRLNQRGRYGAARIFDLAVATRTYPFHLEPDDFYRFSRQAVERVLLGGFNVLESKQVLSPPRILAVGELPGTHDQGR